MWFFHSLFWVVLCTLLVPKKQKTITEPCNSSEIKRGCVPLPFPVNLGSYDINSTALCNQKAQDKISALQWITNKISCVILLCFTFYTDSSNLANFRHQGQFCLQLCVYACHRLLPNNRNSHVERSMAYACDERLVLGETQHHLLWRLPLVNPTATWQFC